MRRTSTTRETTVSAHGLELYVREQGAGHPLLMLNGIGAHSGLWGPAEAILSLSSQTIAVDCPGTGRSDTPLFPLPMRAIARVVRAVLDERGYDCVDVLGFSFGGAVAQQLAKDAPERIRRLALVSTCCGLGSRPGSFSAVAAASLLLPYEVTNPLGYAYQLWALATWSSLPWLGTLSMPTLVVSGLLDELIPPTNSVQLARLLPNNSLHLLAGAGHLLMFGRGSPEPSLLADFFSSPTLAGSTAWTTGLSRTTGLLGEAV